jgi:hypothetical protein
MALSQVPGTNRFQSLLKRYVPEIQPNKKVCFRSLKTDRLLT